MIIPMIVDLDIETDPDIDLDVEESAAIDLDVIPSLIVPQIPENYCRFEWDGTRLRFS